MKLSASDARALTLLIGFGLSMGLYLYVIEPLLDRHKAASEGISEAQDALRKANDQIKQFTSRKDYLIMRKKESALLRGVFGGVVPPEQRLGAALNEFQRSAGMAQVKLGGMRPLDSKPIPEALFDDRSFELEFSGAYENACRMLYLLESGRMLAEIKQCDLTSKDGKDVKIRLLLTAEYVRETSQPAVSPVQASIKQVLKLGLDKRVGLAGLYAADRNGFLHSPKAEVNAVAMDTPLAFFEAGDLDALAVESTDFLALRAAGQPVKVVAVLAKVPAPPGVLAGMASGIEKIQDLASKQVALRKYSSLHYALFRMLDRNKLKLGEIRIKDGEPAQASAWVTTGEADAAPLDYPWIERALDSGKAYLIPDTAHYGEGDEDISTYLVLAVREDALARQPEAVALMVDGLLKGVTWLRANPALEASLTAQQLWGGTEEIKAQLKRVELLDRDANVRLLGAEGVPGEWPRSLAPHRTFLQEQCGVSVPESALAAYTAQYIPVDATKPAASAVPATPAAPVSPKGGTQ